MVLFYRPDEVYHKSNTNLVNDVIALVVKWDRFIDVVKSGSTLVKLKQESCETEMFSIPNFDVKTY